MPIINGMQKIPIRKIKTKLITEECDVDCYIIRGGDIDVRLKDY